MNSAAGTQIASAMSQPSNRSGMGPGGVQAGSTNVISVARCPAAMISLSTPAKVTTTPRTNITATLSHGMRRHQRAKRDQDGAVDGEAEVGQRTGRPVAGEIDEDQQGDRTEDREHRCLRPPPTAKLDRGRDREHYRRPGRAT